MGASTRLIVLVLTIGLTLTAHRLLSNSPASSTSTQFQLKVVSRDITRNILQIDNRRDFKIKVLNNEQLAETMTDGGAQLTGYFFDGQLYKMREQLGLSFGVKTYQYYYAGGTLIAVIETEETFPVSTTSGDLDYSTTILSFKGYYYFERDAIFTSSTTGSRKYQVEPTVEALASQFVKDARENQGLLSRAPWQNSIK